jgi:hypothetical protein
MQTRGNDRARPGASQVTSLQALLAVRARARSLLPASVERELDALTDFVAGRGPDGSPGAHPERRHFPSLGLIVRRYDGYVAWSAAPCARPACLRPVRPGRPANDVAWPEEA